MTGSFDSVSGRYSFQGRQFDVDPTSSINFHGDLNPELDVAVTRTISAVDRAREHDRTDAASRNCT